MAQLRVETDGSLFPFCLQLLRSTRNVTQRSHGDPEARHRNLDQASTRWCSLDQSQRSRCRHGLSAQAHQVRLRHVAPFVHLGCKIILDLTRRDVLGQRRQPKRTGHLLKSVSPMKEDSGSKSWEVAGCARSGQGTCDLGIGRTGGALEALQE